MNYNPANPILPNYASNAKTNNPYLFDKPPVFGDKGGIQITLGTPPMETPENSPENTPETTIQKTPVQTTTVDKNGAGLRLDRWLREHYRHVPFSHLQKKLRKGEIRLNGKRAKGAERLGYGDTVRIPPLPIAGDQPKKSKKPDLRDKDFIRDLIIYDTNDIVAINKPAGIAVQGGSQTKRHIAGMLPWLQDRGGETPRLVHRLDKDTSGVMMFARNRQTAHELGQHFRNRQTRKIYWAIVVGELERDFGIIDEPIVKGGKQGSERMFVNPDDPNAKSAITWFSVIERLGNRMSLVALWPRTGRTHQLRVHMSALDCPIMGDGKYGGATARMNNADYAKQMALHARELVDPLTGKTITADLPPHVLKVFDVLGLNIKDIDTTIDPFAPLLDME